MTKEFFILLVALIAAACSSSKPASKIDPPAGKIATKDDSF